MEIGRLRRTSVRLPDFCGRLRFPALLLDFILSKTPASHGVLFLHSGCPWVIDLESTPRALFFRWCLPVRLSFSASLSLYHHQDDISSILVFARRFVLAKRNHALYMCISNISPQGSPRTSLASSCKERSLAPGRPSLCSFSRTTQQKAKMPPSDPRKPFKP